MLVLEPGHNISIPWNQFLKREAHTSELSDIAVVVLANGVQRSRCTQKNCESVEISTNPLVEIFESGIFLMEGANGGEAL